MKKALISPKELVYKYDGTLLGQRVAQVADQSFEITLPLFWIDCDDSVIADQFYYDGSSIQPIPAKPAPSPITPSNGGAKVVA